MTQEDKSAKPEGGAKKTGKGVTGNMDSGEANVLGPIARSLVRAIWAQEYMLANPDTPVETRQAAWREAREATIAKNFKVYRKALNSLTRMGVVMSMTESAGKTSASDEDDNED